MRNKLVQAVLAGAATFVFTAVAHAYVMYTDPSTVYVEKWYTATIPVEIQLDNTTVLSDGNTQAAVAKAAMLTWNTKLGVIQFDPTIASGTAAKHNQTNEISMADTLYGDAFSSGTLAVTLNSVYGNSFVESDIVVNSAYSWDSYAGSLRTKQDLHRVLLHELGHILGLKHPDDFGQQVTAVMNSRESNTDSLQLDDIAGAQRLYGAPGVLPANDQWANAAVIGVSSGTSQFTGSTVGATIETSEPATAGSTGQHTIWWKWIPTVSGNATLTTLGSDFDTTLGVYTGTAVSALTTVAENDDEDPLTADPVPQDPARKRTSKVAFAVTAGTTYMIDVGGFGRSRGDVPSGYTGAVTLNVSLDPTPGGGSGGTPAPTTTHVVNIATRAYCGTDAQVTIGGFVVTGTGAKTILIRAVGPTLAGLGLPSAEVLSDPVMEVHQGNATIATNDNWTDNANAAEITSVSKTVGATPLLSTDTKSSALLITLTPGAYTFVVKGNAGATGVVLLEAYDTDTTNTAMNFVNIATRANAQTGNGVTIGGFVIGGTTPKQVLLRAVGPSLTNLGVSGALADPQLELHQGSATIAVNDDWSTGTDAASIRTVGARVGATPFASDDTKSAAVLATLSPGAYTFIASGKNGTSGVVLVEVYDAD